MDKNHLINRLEKVESINRICNTLKTAINSLNNTTKIKNAIDRLRGFNDKGMRSIEVYR